MTATSSQPMLPRRVEPTSRALAAAIVGIGLASLGFFAVSDWESRTAERRFAALAQDNVRTLQHGVDHYLERLIGLRALFHGAHEAKVSRGGFETFARELMQDLPGLFNLAWSPRVLHAERDAHEQSAREDGIPGYRISAIDATGKKAGPQTARADYYPVLYSTLPYGAPAYGIDLQDGGVRQRPLDKARDLDTIAATENFRLQSGRGNGYEFYAVLPVYRPGAPHRTLEDRRANILGFVRSTFQFHLMVDTALSDVQAPVSVFVFETGDDGADLPIYARSHGMMSDEEVSRAQLMSQDLVWVGGLGIAGRRWDVVVVPNGAASFHHSRAWIVLGAGLIITLLVAGYVWTSTRYVRMLEEANTAILEQAHTDPLTGLSNRRHFVEKLTEAFATVGRTGDRFAVHFLDLDGFKEVNDQHGHPMGDALLQQVANRLRACSREIDFVARFGGDEFAVLQTLVTSPLAASIFAEKLVAALAAPYRIEGVELDVTASLGVALHTPQVDGPTSVMMQADLALYSAKAAGRNRVRIYGSDLGSGAPAAPADVEAARSSAA